MAGRTASLASLERVLDGIGTMAVAVSGGVDSLTLSSHAHRYRNGAVQMFHAVSPAVPTEATARVQSLARREGWALQIIDAAEFSDPRYRANPVDRCFYCKSHLYDAIASLTDAQIVSGTNLDDLGEYRPGLDAARSRSVRHPYVEAGIGKQALREIARGLGLGEIAELPASPCLSSRIETAIVIEPDMLDLVHRVENLVREATAAGTVRCRLRGSGMVIELDSDSLAALDSAAEAAIRSRASHAMAIAGRHYPLAFELYRNGSAFIHEPAGCAVAAS